MAPKGKALKQLSAAELHEKYGAELREPPYVHAASPYLLQKLLVAGNIQCTYGAVRTWWTQYRVVDSGDRLTSAEALQEQYGSIIAHYAVEHATPFKLCQALLRHDPPICISDAVAKQWLLKYGGQEGVKLINNAAQLELECGERIRACMAFDNGDALASWLMTELKVSVPSRICQHWLSKDWDSSGRIVTVDGLEVACGMKIRLAQCYVRHGDGGTKTVSAFL